MLVIKGASRAIIRERLYTFSDRLLDWLDQYPSANVCVFTVRSPEDEPHPTKLHVSRYSPYGIGIEGLSPSDEAIWLMAWEQNNDFDPVKIVTYFEATAKWYKIDNPRAFEWKF